MYNMQKYTTQSLCDTDVYFKGIFHLSGTCMYIGKIH